MQLGHGHGRTHTYVTGDATIGHGHGSEHAYVTAPAVQKQAISVSWDHHNDAPETWSEDYRKWTKERPHGAAVSQAQEHVRRHHPVMEMELGSVEDATSSMQSMLRRNGHPAHDEGFVMKHPNASWGQSQAFTSDGQPGVSLHPSKWDYGTLAHEVAHHLHENELGFKPRDDATAHGPDFVRHYQSVLKDFGKGAPEKLGEKYQEALGRIRAQASRKCPCGTGVMRDGDEWVHLDGSISHDGEFYDKSVSELMKDAACAEPHERLFGPTFGLDKRLFEGERLRSQVRVAVLAKFDDFCSRHGYRGWRTWGKVVFFGSEASNWTSPQLIGNGDFDLSIGVDYPVFRKENPRHSVLSNQEIASMLTEQMHAELNDPQYYFEV